MHSTRFDFVLLDWAILGNKRETGCTSRFIKSADTFPEDGGGSEIWLIVQDESASPLLRGGNQTHRHGSDLFFRTSSRLSHLQQGVVNSHSVAWHRPAHSEPLWTHTHTDTHTESDHLWIWPTLSSACQVINRVQSQWTPACLLTAWRGHVRKRSDRCKICVDTVWGDGKQLKVSAMSQHISDGFICKQGKHLYVSALFLL